MYCKLDCYEWCVWRLCVGRSCHGVWNLECAAVFVYDRVMWRVGDINSKDTASRGPGGFLWVLYVLCTNDLGAFDVTGMEIIIFLIPQKPVSLRGRWNRIFDILVTLVNLRPLVTKRRHTPVFKYIWMGASLMCEQRQPSHSVRIGRKGKGRREGRWIRLAYLKPSLATVRSLRLSLQIENRGQDFRKEVT